MTLDQDPEHVAQTLRDAVITHGLRFISGFTETHEVKVSEPSMYSTDHELVVEIRRLDI